MHNIKYSKQAQIDIDEAILYIATESKINALEYLSRYEAKIELLKRNPHMGVECKQKLITNDVYLKDGGYQTMSYFELKLGVNHVGN